MHKMLSNSNSKRKTFQRKFVLKSGSKQKSTYGFINVFSLTDRNFIDSQLLVFRVSYYSLSLFLFKMTSKNLLKGYWEEWFKLVELVKISFRWMWWF